MDIAGILTVVYAHVQMVEKFLERILRIRLSRNISEYSIDSYINGQ